MNCREAEHHISAERDRALDTNQQQALMEHVAECAACRRLREDLTVSIEAWRMAEQQVRVPSADIEWQKLRREIRGGASTTTRRSIGAWLAVPLAAAAAIAIGLFVSPDIRHFGTPSRPSETVVRDGPPSGASIAAASVVYVDDKSGWTFVWAPDGA